MPDIDSSFSALYEVERLYESSLGEFALRFAPTTLSPPPKLALDVSGRALYLKVSPRNGSPWKGQFAAGPEGLDGIYSTPSPNTLCVVVRGQGYWIDVLTPREFQIVQSNPVKKVIPLVSNNIILFVDYIRISAYGPLGFIWTTEDVSWDGVSITGVSESSLSGEGWDSPKSKNVPFTIDLATGEVEGGSSPKKYGA